MIKRLKSIKKFGSFSNFIWAGDLADFDRKNIIYGWNYSGKTTISRIFASLNQKVLHCDYPDAQFTAKLSDSTEINQENIETSNLKIEVFNSDFIKSNLFWDTNKGSESISFDIGEDIHGYRNKKKSNEDEIDRINGKGDNKGEIDQYRSVVENFENFNKSRFTEWAKKIRKDIFNNSIAFDKRHLASIVLEIKDKSQKEIIKDQTKLQDTHSQAIQTENKEILPEIDCNLKYDNIRESVSIILRTAPEKKELLAYLDNTDYYNWAKEGWELQKKSQTDKCAFCGNELTEKRLDKLNIFFSNEESKLRETIRHCREQLNNELTTLNNKSFSKSRNDYMPKCQSAFQQHLDLFNDAKNAYKKLLKNLNDELSRKENNNIFNSLEISNTLPTEEINLSQWMHNLNSIIKENNIIVENFENEKETAKKTLQKHHIATMLIQEYYIRKEEKAHIASVKITELEQRIKYLRSENTDLQTKLDNIVAGKDELNKYISSFLGREDIVVELTDEKKFLLKRNSIIAKNLSEGEKMAIAFAYFLVRLQSLHTKNELINTIVFIDDPISSLDSNHISQVYTLINSFFFRKGLDVSNPEKITNCFLQLFISTHNFEFFSFLRDSSMIHRKDSKDSNGNKISSHKYYLIHRGKDECSIITSLPKYISKYKSEYVYLFSLIIDYYNVAVISNPPKEYQSVILIPNAIRRFLEIYSLMKLPHSSDSFENRISELLGEVNQLKFLNHFSHFTTFEKIIKHDELINILPEATKELILLLKESDKKHYDSLLKAIE